ncbi:hypothetical protein CALVIDRAFT_47906 [Calocera viscosa TUFC12733]|uniref:REJ domain-containing protein n=1 Tax=Calocera viscosa (strain TUFC12733) TaxID=1330018 RepID=A0A167FJ27_CALVF|nr:hypothetical protein CALVIDRAFT_47906 [Calocera viscosa TUFC12733]
MLYFRLSLVPLALILFCEAAVPRLERAPALRYPRLQARQGTSSGSAESPSLGSSTSLPTTSSTTSSSSSSQATSTTSTTSTSSTESTTSTSSSSATTPTSTIVTTPTSSAGANTLTGSLGKRPFPFFPVLVCISSQPLRCFLALRLPPRLYLPPRLPQLPRLPRPPQLPAHLRQATLLRYKAKHLSLLLALLQIRRLLREHR